MPSFDVVSEANMVEVHNAVDQTNKEIGTRFDFRGSDARVEQKDADLTIFADSDFQLRQVQDVLTNKMTKRKVDIRFLEESKIEKIGGDKVKQVITIRNGIQSDMAKKIVKLVKDNKLKVQASIFYPTDISEFLLFQINDEHNPEMNILYPDMFLLFRCKY